MATVAELLARKGAAVFTVAPEAHAYDALRLMAEKGVGTILVTAGGKVRGIVSERDVLRKVSLKGLDPRAVPITAIMTRGVIFVKPEQSLEDCMELMTGEKIRHLPVMNGDELAGIVSIGDVVKFMISEKETMIKHYEKYIYECY